MQVTLSNGEESPVIKTVDGDRKNHCCIRISKDTERVGIKCDGTTLVAGLKFIDSEQEESKWEYSYSAWQERQVPSGHRIIGVYGYISPDSDFIQNFGFVTVAYR